ncbi:bisphosphoglycerate-dependent phosphoglycerate mutase [Nannochloropsis gaditana]|uniref:phosphoglycerate mutase (2,3-diphosphoglycerate-dependent) n=1 Tax=Nannochloropsis gaditana TaxID=72520 RepID=W7U0D1_9STRA|nr:bisphosphoglycerate-dependent phosphoglycerate mutase [Nannochloropsis gaditana]
MCQRSRLRKVALYPTIAWSKESTHVERRPGRRWNRDCVAGFLALMAFLGRGDRVVLAFSLPSVHRAHADHQAFHRNVYISHPTPSRTAQPFPPASPPLFVSRKDHASEGNPWHYRLILLRHGESVWNRDGRYIGWTDVPLTERGEREAQAAGRMLRQQGLRPCQVFTSYLKRCVRRGEGVRMVIVYGLPAVAFCVKAGNGVGNATP